MIISRYTKQKLLTAVDSYIDDLLSNRTPTLKSFGVIGDIVEYALLKFFDSITAHDCITVIENKKPLTSVEYKQDRPLEEALEVEFVENKKSPSKPLVPSNVSLIDL
jgi:hypothetical protein